MDLPQVSEPELVEFLSTNAAALGIGPSGQIGALVRRRRRSIDHHIEDPYGSDEDPLQRLLAYNGGPCHVLVLGDDTSAKQQLVVDYTLKVEAGAPSASPPICPLEAKVTRPAVGSPMIIFCPPTDEDSVVTRAELIRAAQCIVLVFTVTDQSTLESCTQRWIKEILSVQAELGHRIPIVLVGADADRRILGAEEGRPSPSPLPTRPQNMPPATEYIPAEVAVQAAQAIKASKYVEVHRGNAVHAFELFLQALRIAGPGNRPKTAAAQAALVDTLKCPLPTGRFDMLRSGVCITPIEQLDGQILLATWDGSDPRVSKTAFVIDCSSDEGFVPLSKGMPRALLLAIKAPSLFPSEVAEILLPQKAAPPRAWFNAINKTCVVVGGGLGAAIESDWSKGQTIFRYTIDGSDPNENSAVYRGPIHLDDSPIEDEGVVSPFHIEAIQGRSAPKIIKVKAYRTNGFYLPSVTTELAVPNLIETPKVMFNAMEGLLTISNAQPQWFDYRYTLDGSTPTAGGEPRSTCYSYIRPVTVSIEGGIRRLRVAAFPKQWFPSEEIVIDVKPLVRRDDKAAHAIGATKASGLRSASAHYHRSLTSHNSEVGGHANAGATPVVDRLTTQAKNVVPQSTSAVVSVSNVAGHRASRIGTFGTEPRGLVDTPSFESAPPPRQATPPRGHVDPSTQELVPRRQSPAKRPTTGPTIQRGLYGSSRPTTPTTSSKANFLSPTRASKAKQADVPSEQGSTHASEAASRRVRVPATGRAASPVAKKAVQGQGKPRTTSPVQRSASSTSHPAAPSRSSEQPSCRSDGNSVYFDFPIPIILSHITITTPGRAKGPDAYEVLVRAKDSNEAMSVGMGDLQDIEGVQTMHVVSAARTMELTQVVCKLTGSENFEVLDMKVHGKPKAASHQA